MTFALKTVALALALSAGTSFAQGTPRTAAPASAPAPVSPAKKALVQKLLKLQEPAIENLARQLAEQPAATLMQQAGQAVQSMPADKREAVARDIQADVKKYVDEAVPIVRDKAMKLTPTVLAPMLEQNFSEDELKTIITWVESPVSKKFAQFAPQLQQALAEKLVTETRDAIEPKARALQASMAQRLGAKPNTAPAPAAASGAKKK